MTLHLLRFRVLIPRACPMALCAKAAGLAGLSTTPRFVQRSGHYRASVSSSSEGNRSLLKGVQEGQAASKRFTVAPVLTAMPNQPSVAFRTTSLHASGNDASASSAQQLSQISVAGDACLEAAALKDPVVTVQWLHANLHSGHIKVVDASWYMPAEARNPYMEFEVAHIPNALFFDLDKVVDLISTLPHMLPCEDAFAAAVSALGIKNEDLVVVYDGKGIFSSSRVWWMFRTFGHDKVAVLDGGLPKWQAEGYEIENGIAPKTLEKIEASSAAVGKVHDGEVAFLDKLSFKAVLQSHLVWSMDQVKQNLVDKRFQLLDARSKGRFDGTTPEPRPGMRGGHIPGSTCIPFTKVLSTSGTLLSAEELEKLFKDEGVSLGGPIVASCGTGVTACILALALHRLRNKDVPVYDGSWTEWAVSPDTPVVVTEAGSTS